MSALTADQLPKPQRCRMPARLAPTRSSATSSSGWRYDISGLSPAMRTDYDQHLSDCTHCRRRQRIARTIDVLLICVSTLSILAFLLAAVVIHRIEVVTHMAPCTSISASTAIAISLEAVAVAGLVFSTLLWVLVAIATPLPGFLGERPAAACPRQRPHRHPRPLQQARRLSPPTRCPCTAPSSS